MEGYVYKNCLNISSQADFFNKEKKRVGKGFGIQEKVGKGFGIHGKTLIR